jgi:membrane associated rhomboid family serine protease
MVIPVHDANPVSRPAVVTRVLIVVNVAVFVLSPLAFGFLGGSTPQETCREGAYVERWGAVPEELLSGEQLPTTVGPPARDQLGRVGCLVVPSDGEKRPLLSVLTAMFVHGGWAHLAGNMLFLLIFGNNVEDRMGRLRFFVFYLAAGFFATYAYALLNPDSTTGLVGASGAIAGVLGAYFVMFPHAKVVGLVPFLFFLPLRLPAWLVLGFWFVLQYFYSLGAGVTGEAGVAFEAHVAGFLFGMVVAALFYGRQRPRRAWPGRSGTPPWGGRGGYGGR